MARGHGELSLREVTVDHFELSAPGPGSPIDCRRSSKWSDQKLGTGQGHGRTVQKAVGGHTCLLHRVGPVLDPHRATDPGDFGYRATSPAAATPSVSIAAHHASHRTPSEMSSALPRSQSVAGVAPTALTTGDARAVVEEEALTPAGSFDAGQATPAVQPDAVLGEYVDEHVADHRSGRSQGRIQRDDLNLDS